MNQISEFLRTLPKYYNSKAATCEQIIEAEKKLNLKFSREYIDYLKEYGAISFGGHEITGLNVDDYLDVVAVTLAEREINNDFPKNCLVLQNLGIEGILVLSDTEGKVYEYSKGHELKKIAESLYEYLKLLK